MTVPILKSWTWPWTAWTLHALYLASGLVIALHYVPQIRLAWRHPRATATAQSLSTWSVWTLCRLVALAYAVFVIHDLLFLLVVSADIVGRVMMVILIIRAHLIADGLVASEAESLATFVRGNFKGSAFGARAGVDGSKRGACVANLDRF